MTRSRTLLVAVALLLGLTFGGPPLPEMIAVGAPLLAETGLYASPGTLGDDERREAKRQRKLAKKLAKQAKKKLQAAQQTPTPSPLSAPPGLVQPPVGSSPLLPPVKESAAPGAAGQITLTPTPTASPTRSARAQVVPVPTLVQTFAGLTQPVFVTHAGDGSSRLFVVERGGTIRVAINGQLQATPFLNVSSIINSSGQEQGLLGLAFHPDYASNGRFFIWYTAAGANGDNTLARYTVSANPNVADAASATVLFTIADFAANHNGGTLAFGPDGFLYISTGDGGGANDPQGNGQRLDTLLGKMLRIDVNNFAPGLQYSSPPSNPFFNTGGGARQEIWALGLRNPFRTSFDRSTGDLYIADVGQGAWEEVNFHAAGSPSGENYGWKIMEGLHCFSPMTGCNMAGLTLPVHEYPHSGGKCSVTGGYVYRGTVAPSMVGVYFFGDFCTGEIFTLRRNGSGAWISALWLDTSLNISSFGEDQAGEVYVVDLTGGRVYRLLERTCLDRPPIGVAVIPSGPGSVQVTVIANTNASVPANSLLSLRFGTADGGVIDVGSTIGSAGNFTVGLPAGTQSTTFHIQRVPGAPAATVPFWATDECGEVQKFAGLGSAVP